MRKITITILMVTVAGFTFGQSFAPMIQPPVSPINPIVLGQGGSFTANARGYYSLYLNPAGLAMGDRSFEITPLTVDIYGFTDRSVIDYVVNIEENIAAIEEAFANLENLPMARQTDGTDGIDNEFLQELLASMGGEDLGPIGGMLEGIDEQWVIDNEEYLREAAVDLGIPADTIPTDLVNIDPDELLAMQDYLESEEFQDIINDPDFEDKVTQAALNLVVKTGLADDILEELNIPLPQGNIRVGAHIGALGILVKGFGFGIGINGDAFVRFDGLRNTGGSITATVMATVGYAHKIGDFLSIGLTARPMYRVFAPISVSDILMESIMGETMGALAGVNVYYGFGIGFDAGAILSLGPLNIGVVLRDIAGTRFFYSEAMLAEFADSVQTGEGFPEGTKYQVEGSYPYIPMDLAVGVQLRPTSEKLKKFVDPEIHLELRNTIAAIQKAVRAKNDPDYVYDYNFLETLHIGGNVKFLSFLNVAAGFTGGLVNVGLGIDMFVAELNLAGFFKVSDVANQFGYADYGASVEFAIRI
jgi:hypothetical protein